MLTNADISRVSSLLKQLDCNERESETYLYCLGLGPASVQQIARGLKQNRLTIHSVIEQLIEKGFLYESRKGKRRLIVAKQPDVLLDIIQRKQNELGLMMANAEHIVPLLNLIHPKGESVPAVKFYENTDGLKTMLEETLTAKGEVLVFSNVQLLANLLDPVYLEVYLRRRAAKNIYTRLIFPPCDFANRVSPKAEQYKMEIRLVPESYYWKSGIFLWNDSLALLSYTKEKITCTIVDNADIAELFRSVMFDLCWKQAKPMKKC